MTTLSSAFIIIIYFIFSKSCFLEGSSLSQYVNGSLEEQCSFNIKIFLETVKGVLLYIFDGERNQFGVIIKNNMFLCIHYNQFYHCGPLVNICGCDSCEGRIMMMDLQLSRRTIYYTCNNRMLQTLYLEDLKKKNKEEGRPLNIFLLPKKMMKNDQGLLFIMIGNIVPYTSENNETILPMKEQIVGCLEEFGYNNQIIKLQENGMKVLGSCPRLCNGETCHGGYCRRKTVHDFFCDCSMTALNGEFCNKSMKEYFKGGNNNYIKIKSMSEIYFKLTWKVKSVKNYCLVSVEGRNEYFTIWFNKGEVKINKEVIMNVSLEDVHFMKVMMNNRGLTIQINNKESRRKLLLNEDIKIKVGISPKDKGCETFEGLYDFHYDLRHLRLISQSDPGEGKSRQISIWDIINKIAIPSGAVVMFIILVICGLKILLSSSCSKVQDSNNDTVAESVELRVTSTERDLRSASGLYSTVDYTKMNRATRNDNEDSDGYVVPKPAVIEEDCPPLPPRNENLL